jgi:hypothetical protein
VGEPQIRAGLIDTGPALAGRYTPAVARRPLYLHVGTGKSGTSSLQRGLWLSTEELAKEGVGLPFVERTPAVRRLLAPLGWAISEGFTRPIDHARLGRLARRLSQTRGDVLLITNEDLAEASEDSVDAFFDAIGSDLEPRIIVTARDWAKQLPSDYQQLLKHNVTETYDSFLQHVRDRVGIGRQFWLRQDLPGICERWGRHLDPAHVHVIPVPPYRVDPEAVYRLFGNVVGFDHHALNIPSRDTNASFGAVETELLRRFNASLGGRLANYQKGYLPAVRKGLIQRSIARGASARITLPPEHVGWVHELAQQRLDLLRQRGYTLHGDPSLLVPSENAGESMPQVSDAAIADAAIATLARFVVHNFKQQQRKRPPGARKGRDTERVERRQ